MLSGLEVIQDLFLFFLFLFTLIYWPFQCLEAEARVETHYTSNEGAVRVDKEGLGPRLK